MPVPVAQALRPVRLGPGPTQFVYHGVAQPLVTFLQPLAGKYRSVYVRAPNGQPIVYTPGMQGAEHFLIIPGSVVSIDMIEAVTILLPAP